MDGKSGLRFRSKEGLREKLNLQMMTVTVISMRISLQSLGNLTIEIISIRVYIVTMDLVLESIDLILRRDPTATM